MKDYKKIYYYLLFGDGLKNMFELIGHWYVSPYGEKCRDYNEDKTKFEIIIKNKLSSYDVKITKFELIDYLNGNIAGLNIRKRNYIKNHMIKNLTMYIAKRILSSNTTFTTILTSRCIREYEKLTTYSILEETKTVNHDTFITCRSDEYDKCIKPKNLFIQKIIDSGEKYPPKLLGEYIPKVSKRLVKSSYNTPHNNKSKLSIVKQLKNIWRFLNATK